MAIMNTILTREELLQKARDEFARRWIANGEPYPPTTMDK